ncbi:KAP family P-loop NTPase fold protein [Anaerostipes hadrus]|jgi:hypothetical protein|uniref:KAP family P-loop NTPase fold protein n=1 Tax=Anaerostipes hadrus TaxID=649756 RepID=UPI0032C09680
MKNFEIMPTEENLLKAIKENILKRNDALVYFYKLLLAQDNGTIIAIDGRWGSGKTFFVKQEMMIINAMNPRSKIEQEVKQEILNSVCIDVNKKENYDLAIYYDAWENDNDIDPIISLIYEISMQIGDKYMFESDINFFKMVVSIVECINGKNIKSIIDSLKDENPLIKFQKQKELDNQIEDFFTHILAERGQRLVVFIDELDRCKPSFAVQLLEQIKHYLCDDRIIFVLSVNLEELQYTIKHFYGNEFDASRYLDRFFNLRIPLPPADKKEFYNKLELYGDNSLDKVVQRFINVYNMELREISRFYIQNRAAVYRVIYSTGEFDFSFTDGYARKFMLTCMVPIVVGLKMVDVSLYEEFISGNNPEPMINIFNAEEFMDLIRVYFLGENESFNTEESKETITLEEKIIEIYNAIFVNQYSAKKNFKAIGHCRFNENSKKIILTAASMLSKYANYEI